MRYMRLGRSGLSVSRVALGTWRTWGSRLDYEQAERCFRAAHDAGVNFVDLADVYGGGQAEAWLGWMTEPLRREDIVISTKIFWATGDGPNDRGLSAKHLTEALDASLGRLKTDYLDLLFCHRLDPETPMAETVRTVGRWIADGKVLYWGVSTDDVAGIVELCRTCDALGVPRPIANQPMYSLADRRIETSVLPTCRRLGMGQTVFSPLAQGALLERLKPLADEFGTTPARVALAWCLRQPDVCVIFGASSPEQVLDDVGADGLELPTELCARLEDLVP